MKKIFFSFALASLAFVACNNEGSNETTSDNAATENQLPTDVINNTETAGDEPIDPATLAGIEFDRYEHDFGKVDEGKTVETVFTFTNTGANDLIISDAKGSCGCTVPYFPKEPIKPGKTGEIKVSYDSKGKSGVQKKMVTITANTN